MFWFLLFCLPFAASLPHLLPGCCGGSERSESQKTITSKKEGSKPDKKASGQKSKSKSISRQLEVPQQPQTKEGEEGKAAGEGGGRSDKTVKKESKRGQSSKKGKERVLESTQNVTKSDEDAQQAQQSPKQQPQQEQNRTVTPPQPSAEVKAPNEFEKAAAGEGVVINPEKVKRMGNIDEIHEARKEEQNKELEQLKSQVSKSMKGSKEKEGKKVTINEGQCKVYETADCPTLDDEADNENEEDPV